MAETQPVAKHIEWCTGLVELGSPRFHEACANAEFIVRACNSYDAMLEALRTSREALLGLASFLAEQKTPVETTGQLHAADKAVKQIDAAIQKAEAK